VRRQNITTFNYASESFRNDDRLPFQATMTQETKEALDDLNVIRNWSQLRSVCEEQEQRRKEGLRW